MLWGGRFNKEIDSKALDFSSSLSFDINLIFEDVEGSRAHAAMLAEIGILNADESAAITDGLTQIENEYKNGLWIPEQGKFEDVHSAVEARLYELCGAAAGKLHTGRSRNDQIAADIKLWLKKAADAVGKSLSSFQTTLLNIAEKHTETIIPGYTHLQRAQPVSLAFHLLAYVEMFERDKKRISFVKSALNESPLGAGALAGSTLPLDREFTSSRLGFDRPTGNALDTVSDRDFILDFLHACNTGMMHLSRLSEEIIIWSSYEWNLIKLPDEYTTGSSLMPQKKNPDMAELARGKSGRVYGNYTSVAVTLKGLPLSYNRDLQEDKEPLFDSFYTWLNSLDLLNASLKSALFNTERFIKELEGDFSLATDLADWLVLKGIPFREAHHITGTIVSILEKDNKNFSGITMEMLKEIHPVFDESVLECFSIAGSLSRKKTFGSPNPSIVSERIAHWWSIL